MTSITFLGIVVDTVAFQLRLPEEKLQVMRGLVGNWSGRRSCPYKELESLLGHLSHAASVIIDGKLFTRHLFTLLGAARSRHHYVHLDGAAQADLSWWGCVLHHWNGRSFFPFVGLPDLHLFTDASGTFGCGGLVTQDARWFQVEWPPSWAQVNIAVKELVPVVMAAALWGRSWSAQLPY